MTRKKSINRHNNIGIRRIIALIMAAVFFLILSVLFVVFGLRTRYVMEQWERKALTSQIEIAQEALDTMFTYVPELMHTYLVPLSGDDVLQGGDVGWLAQELASKKDNPVGIDFSLLMDNNGNVLHEDYVSGTVDAPRKVVEEDEDAVQAFAREVVPVLGASAKKQGAGKNVLAGFTKINGRLVAASASVITWGNTSVVYVIGKFVDEAELHELSDSTGADIKILNASETDLTAKQIEMLEQSHNYIFKATKTGGIQAYNTYPDIFGKQNFIMQVTGEWDLQNQSNIILIRLVSIVGLCCLIILVTLLVLLNKMVVAPMQLLAGQVNKAQDGSAQQIVPRDNSYKEFSQLEKSINGLLRKSKLDIDAMREKERELLYRATYDSLTGLLNWRMCAGLLEEEIALARVRKHFAAVFYIGLSQIRFIKSKMGNAAGDQYVKAAAMRLQQGLPDAIALGRANSDKFMVVASGFTSPEELDDYAARVMGLFVNDFDVLGKAVRISVSVGYSSFPMDASDANELIKNAELAMYHCKEVGRNMCCSYERSLNAEWKRRMYIQTRLHNSVAEGCKEFGILFQPELVNGVLGMLGSEVLVRWVTPEGIVEPEEFMPLAEEIGLDIPLFWWVLREVMCSISYLEEQGLTNPVTVNISAGLLREKDFIQVFSRMMEETGASAAMLNLSIADAALMGGDAEWFTTTLAAIRTMGVGVVIADKPQGYSSFGYLKNNEEDEPAAPIPIYATDDEDERGIVQAIESMARDLHGEEAAQHTEESSALMQNTDIGEFTDTGFEGFFVSKPFTLSEYVDFATEWEKKHS